MKLVHKLALLSFTGIVTATAAPAFADDQKQYPSLFQETKMMANKDGMVSKQDYMKMMEKRFDAMDKAKTGMLSTQDIMRIFNDKTGS
jgi:hypothetical protein